MFKLQNKKTKNSHLCVETFLLKTDAYILVFKATLSFSFKQNSFKKTKQTIRNCMPFGIQSVFILFFCLSVSSLKNYVVLFLYLVFKRRTEVFRKTKTVKRKSTTFFHGWTKKMQQGLESEKLKLAVTTNNNWEKKKHRKKTTQKKTKPKVVRHDVLYPHLAVSKKKNFAKKRTWSSKMLSVWKYLFYEGNILFNFKMTMMICQILQFLFWRSFFVLV